jgi:hypothetical protein
VYGPDSELTRALLVALSTHHLDAIRVEGGGDNALQDFSADHDLDYVFLISPLPPELPAPLRQAENKLVLVPGYPAAKNQGVPGHRYLYLGEYLGDTLIGAPTIGAHLQEIETSGSLTIPGDGLESYCLTRLDDLVEGILRAALSTRWQGELVLAAAPTLSRLSLADLIATHLPFKITRRFGGEGGDQPLDWADWQTRLNDLGIVLRAADREDLAKYLEEHPPLHTPPPAPATPLPKSTPATPPPTHQPLARLSVTPKEPSRIRKILATFVEPRRPELEFVPLATRPHPKSRRKSPLVLPRIRISRVIVQGLGIAIALYVGTLGFAGTILGLSVRQQLLSLGRGDYAALATPTILKVSVTYLEGNLLTLRSLPGLGSVRTLSDAQELLGLYHQSLLALDTAAAFADTGAALSKYIVSDTSLDLAPTLSLARLQAEQLYEELSLVAGALPETVPGLLQRQGAAYTKFREEIGAARDASYTARALLSLAPDLVGVGGRRKYLLLFQNNMEQRATGGFIGSFAIMSFENGRLYDLPVYDVYQADGQLKGHVEPPGPIKQILGEANWFMRDSNFDPDFPTSARRAEWFLKKTLNQDVDGTIAINVNTLQALLRALGPLQLADYQETVTADNVYERAQTHAEVNFFPGSTAKKEYLSSVADAIFAKLRTLDGTALTKVLLALSDTLMSRDTMLSLQSAGAEKALALLGWNGQLETRPCPGDATRCADDYLLLVDSNFGVNKANFFVERQLSDRITVTKERTIAHELTVTYTNRSTSTAWPAGAYKNYLRLYLPLGSRVTNIQVGDRILDGSSYAVTSEHNRQVVGFLAEIPIKSTVPVKISYQSGVALVPGGGVYSLYYQKQSGSSSGDPLEFTLNYPLFLKPTVVSPAADIKTQELNFAFQNNADHRLSVKFQE